jgi:hypothetical protein
VSFGTAVPNSLIDYAASRIHDVFDVTLEEARVHASGLVGLIEAKGGVPDQALIEELIEPQLGRELQWRNSERKQQFLEHRAKRTAGYNEYIDRGRKEWWKK